MESSYEIDNCIYATINWKFGIENCKFESINCKFAKVNCKYENENCNYVITNWKYETVNCNHVIRNCKFATDNCNMEIKRKIINNWRQHCVALMAGEARSARFVSRISHLTVWKEIRPQSATNATLPVMAQLKKED